MVDKFIDNLNKKLNSKGILVQKRVLHNHPHITTILIFREKSNPTETLEIGIITPSTVEEWQEQEKRVLKVIGEFFDL